MKKKKINGRTVTFGYANPELHQEMRKLRSAVLIDRKKQSKKNACRSHKRDSGDFLISAGCNPPIVLIL